MKFILSGVLLSAGMFCFGQTDSSQNKTQTITIVRGPYLQQASPNSIIIKWQTSQATDTKVSYGIASSTLTTVATNSAQVTDHEIKLSGLNAYTKYYYNVACSSATLVPAASDVYFRTMPNYGQAGKYRFWAIGDAGTGDNNQRHVRDAFLNYNSNHTIDGWIWLGDNAYESGFNSEYQSNVFTNNIYENVLKNTVVWPAPGNHDYNNHLPFSPAPAYYDIFTLPTNAECGGLASGTEKYYSYNYGNIHFIVLDSYDESRASNGQMATWLQNDLQANTQQWTVAYWHHPPYTKGSHNSDNSNFLDGELVEIRQNIIPILEAKGVDLIVCGHSHVYERSYLLDGHYGYSNQLQPSMIKDNTSGSYPASCAYRKNTQQTSSHKGTVYVVCGCSGKNDATPSSGWPHPVMYKSTNTTYGSMSIDVDHNELKGTFIDVNGTLYDSFTIIKNAGGAKTYTICPNEDFTLKSTVPGQVNWFPGNNAADSLVINTPVSTVYYATDLAGCIRDTFNISVISSSNCTTNTGIEPLNAISFAVYPSLLNSTQTGVTIESPLNILCRIRIIDLYGREIMNEPRQLFEGKNGLSIPEPISKGLYLLKLTTDSYEKTFKLYVE
ncbi:MAG: metallophosphoesterase [Bacteroidetes bacterium]|nr:metallophosphoesterase [Bacteroidota bacterium]